MKNTHTEHLFTDALAFGTRNLYNHFGYLATAALLGTIMAAAIMIGVTLGTIGVNFGYIQTMMIEIKTCCTSYNPELITVWIKNGGWRVLCFIGILLITAFAVARYIALGMIALALAIYDQKPLSLALFFNAYRFLLSDCIATFCYYCIVSIGLAFLILPGLYCMLAFSLYSQYIVDCHAGPFEALGKSFAITKGHKLQLLGIVVVVSIIQTVVAFIFSGLLSFLVFPFVALTMTYVYRELFAAHTRA
ncbi:MAG: hypothetical protein WCE21_00460 [Candidatus Babeliales bacterium]